MLQFMERSTIYYLKHKGWTNVQIAECTGHHRDTIACVGGSDWKANVCLSWSYREHKLDRMVSR